MRPALAGIVLLASAASAGLVVDDSLDRYSLYGRNLVRFEHAASSSEGGWIGSDSLVLIDANDTLRSTVTSGKDFQIDNGADWIWGDVRVANDLGGASMYNDSIMGTTYVGRNLSTAQLNILKGRVYAGGQLTVAPWNHNYYGGADFFNNSASTTFGSPFSISGVTWGVQPQATPYSAWVFPDTTFSASSVSIATSFTSSKDASGKYRWTCGSNAEAGGADLVALRICATNDTILPPGNYGDVNLWYGSTLFLGEGAYSFNNVSLPPSSGTDSTRLLAHQPNGARTVILVKGELDAQVSSRRNVIAPENYSRGYGADSGHFAAGTMMIYAERPVTLGAGLELWATLVVPNHGVTLADQVGLFGQILADTILVKNRFKGADGAYVPFRPGQRIAFAPVAAQDFGTTPTLSATSSSGLPVGFSSSSTGVCTITSGGVLTFATAGTCTIDADQAGWANIAAAPTVSRSFAVTAVAPGAPAIGAATADDGRASVAFTAPASDGGSAITSYTATSSPDARTATGTTSPITVTGLIDGTAYTFTVTATNGAGTSAASAPSIGATPLAPQSIAFGALLPQVYGTASVKLTATASSGLPVGYASANSAAVRISNDTAFILAADTATITASQPGSAGFRPAISVSRTMAISRHPIAVTARDTSKRGGATDPVIPWSATALLGSDTWSGSLSRDPGESEGDYPIHLGTLSAGSNYDVAFRGATFRIRTPSSLGARPVGMALSQELSVRPLRVMASVAVGSAQGSLGTGAAGENELSVEVLLPGAASVTVSIFDDQGTPVIWWSRDVSAFDARRLAPSGDGRTVLPVRWNLRTSDGRPVPSGVYLWKIQVVGADGQELETVRKTGVR